MRRRVLAGRAAASAWLTGMLLALCGACAAQEIAPFSVTGVEGYATVRFMRDDFATGQPGAGGAAGSRSSQVQSDLREELFLMTHSYVYHPNLLSLDIGGGPILQRGSYAADSEQTRSSGALYNFSGRAMFLRDKPYQGSVFYEHLNPTLNVAPGQVLTQENTRYGADFSLLAPVTPVPLYFDATHSHFQGSGADRVIDDRIDRFNMRASTSFGALGSTQFQYQATEQDSMSGSPSLPIQASHSKNQALSVDSRLQFGAGRQYDFTNLITLNTQSYAVEGQSPLADRRDGRIFFDLRGRHSKELQSFVLYNASSSEQGDLGSLVHSAAGGVSYTPRPEFAASVGVHADDSRTRQVSATTRGMDGSVRYQQALPLGVAQASYGVRYDRRDQLAAASQTGVIGEAVTLAGIAFVTLGHQHVNAGSVVVSNATRAQVFAEGHDYALTVVGAETRLQRLAGGAILDPQDLLVDYAYDVGGTFAYDQTEQTLNLNWGLKNFVNAYFRHLDSEPRLRSGLPAYPLNTVKDSLAGVRADIPFRLGLDMAAGGSAEREIRRETISPYRRDASELYLQVADPFSGTGNLRFSVRRTRIDYANSALDVDLIGYDFRYWARFWLGIDLSASVSAESDTGGAVPRRRSIATAKAQWRYRKLSLSVDLGRTLETQGDFKRSRAQVQVVARREF